MIINQSLINKFYYKGEPREYCPYSVYLHSITKEVKRQTESMLKGSFFETLTLGAGIEDKVTDIPRKKLTAIQILAGQSIGDKTIDQIRIEQQALNFERQKAIYQINVQKEVNTQVEIYKLFSKNDDIHLKGTLDIFPTTILLPERGLRLAIIDTKLTGKFSDYGEYCWATPGAMDHTQGYMYHYLVRDIDLNYNLEMNKESKLSYLYTGSIKHQIETNEILFFYWVFTYKDAEVKDKFVEVSWNETSKAELIESIRKTINEINKNERNGWNNVKPSSYACNGCNIIECKERYVGNTFNTNNQFESV
jgi:hypothetical protein